MISSRIVESKDISTQVLSGLVDFFPVSLVLKGKKERKTKLHLSPSLLKILHTPADHYPALEKQNQHSLCSN